MTMMKAALRAAALSSCAVGVAAAAATINNGRASGTSLAFSTTTTATATSKNSGAQQRSRMAAAASGDGSGSATAQEQPLSQQQQPQFKKAIVIGGGVVGVTTAAELAKRGIQVTLIEAGSGFANECSYAAAGGMQRTNPQVNRDSWRATVKSWLASLNPFRANDAPLPGVFISPKVMFDPQFRRWFRLFTVSSLYRSQEDQAYQTQHMLDFTDWAVDSILNVMHEDDGFLAKAANLNTTGALKLLYDECDLDPERHRMFNGREPWGFVQKQDLATVEPSLTSFRPPHTPPCGAIIQYRAAQAHCARFTKAFAERHLEGVEVQTDTRIKELTLSDDETRVAAITTEDRTIDVGADTVVVLAAGSWTPVLSRTAGRFVPVYPMKGYTLLANAADADTQQALPTRVVIESESNLFFSHYGDQLRVAAVGEFSGFDTQPSKRIAQMVRVRACNAFPALSNAFKSAQVVCGLRPFTADGALIIGRDDAVSNLAYNVGPGFNGWKLAVGSAQLLAAVVDNDTAYLESLPFDARVFDPAGRVTAW